MNKSFKTWWERLLFRDRGILPTPRLLLVLGLFSVGLIALSFSGLSWPWIIVGNLMLLGVSLLDLRFSPGKNELQLERSVRQDMERDREEAVDIRITNTSPHSITFKMVDDVPGSFYRSSPVKGRVQGETASQASYTTYAPIRGDYRFDKVYMRYQSRFGLWEKQYSPPIENNVRVVPDLSETRQFLEDPQAFLLYEGPNVKKQQIGSGEFAKIRKYVVGDDLRKINWRQTAKLQELMTNEYEPEHGKYISIFVDCGRMMGVELEESNRLERSLEAALTVAAAALHNGDHVSFIAFSKEVKAYVPPNKGMQHLQRIIDEMYNLQVDPYESNYGNVLQYLQAIQKKRSLLLLFSDVSTFLYEEAPLFYLQRVRRRHVFMMLGIEDHMTEAWTKEAPTNHKQAMIKSMAQKHTIEKKKELAKWEKQGLQMIETPEEKLATSAVSHYIDVMNKGLL
ncbi:DUF58 domain-containing protein [Pontibacillus salicampi]|uniref:DUF58 domain-containing protein n=1 Tax=Pontibacillus salicampi TaxID=1449801 RepID=A0ABV6LUG8_9BACI